MCAEELDTFIGHLETLRRVLLRCICLIVLFYPPAYFFSGPAIERLVMLSFPEPDSVLHYFAPVEVFLVRLKFAFIISIILSYPFNIFQVLGFLMPVFSFRQKIFLSWAAVGVSLLFAGGAFFSLFTVLPLLMKFSYSFASPVLVPTIGLSAFMCTAGWLCLAFGMMFQTPLLVIVLVKIGITSVKDLRQKRPYVLTVILIISAILTPPDVLSQLILALPAAMLFELGIFSASMIFSD